MHSTSFTNTTLSQLEDVYRKLKTKKEAKTKAVANNSLMEEMLRRITHVREEENSLL